jgi:hypothetical protein
VVGSCVDASDMESNLSLLLLFDNMASDGLVQK